MLVFDNQTLTGGESGRSLMEEESAPSTLAQTLVPR